VTTTVAGNPGVYGHLDATGTAALFANPVGIALDGSGTLYVTESSAIRKVSSDGVVTTLAGSEVAGYADASGTNAEFFFPAGVALDSMGNVYVADMDNDAIRMVSPAGVVTTVAGSHGVQGYLDATGTAAQFSHPRGVTVDGNGNIYVADTGNEVIRKITAGAVTTVAGDPGVSGSADGTGATARFHVPVGLAIDGRGNIYVADSYNDTIREMTPAGAVTTVGGLQGIPGTSGLIGGDSWVDWVDGTVLLSEPLGVASSFDGTLYVADFGNNRIAEGVLYSGSYTITPTAGSNGGIAPNTVHSVTTGSNITFTATPSANYVVDQWYLDGSPVQAGGTSYTLADVRAAHTVLVTFNASSQVTSSPGTYDGLFVDGSGFISINLSATGKFSGEVIVAGASHSLDGKFSSTGFWQGASSGNAISLSLQLGGGEVGTPGSYFITGSANSTALTAWHATDGPGQPVLNAGKYTILLTATDAGASIPAGTGYATMTVSAKGGIVMGGRLPDGESFSTSGVLVGGSAGNQFAIYKSLIDSAVTTKSAKGLLVGSLVFVNVTGTSDLSGTLEWTKPQQNKGDYLAAIDTNLNVIGSLYTPPLRGGSVLPGFNGGTLQLNDKGTLSGSGMGSIVKDLTLNSKNAFLITNPGTDKLKVTVTPSSGVFKGTFVYPGQTRPTAFDGVLFQDQTAGGGFFLGPDGGGRVILTSP
jgi:hypothetical protein